jgi:hypothetical protein
VFCEIEPFSTLHHKGIDPDVEGACHETNVSAEQNQTEQDARVPEKDVYETGQKDRQPKTCQGEKTFNRIVRIRGIGRIFLQKGRTDLEEG